MWDPVAEVALKTGEPFLPFMNPLSYLREHKLPQKLALTVVQTEMLGALSSFLNGETVTGRCRWVYPVVDRVNFGRLRRLGNLIRYMKHQELETATFFDHALDGITRLEARGSSSPSDTAEILSRFYAGFRRGLERTSQVTRRGEIPACTNFNPDIYRLHGKGILSPLIDLSRDIRAFLSPYIAGAWLHGSLSTLDYQPGWSDVDLLLLVRKETVLDPKRLLELRRCMIGTTRYLYAIDPLQHHGYFCITEYDFQCYPEPYFPLVLFENATQIYRAPECMSLQVRDSGYERQRFLWQVLHYYRSAVLGHQHLAGMYGMKGFISGLMILPALYLQSKEQYCYKKYSFERVKQEFSRPWWEFYERISAVRSTRIRFRMGWNLCQAIRRAGLPLSGSSCQGWIFDEIPKEWSEVGDPSFIEEANRFSEAILDRCWAQGLFGHVESGLEEPFHGQ